MLYTIQKECAAENKTLIGLNSHAHSHKELWQLSQTRMHGQTDRQADRLTDWLTDRLTVEHANCLPLSAHHKHTPHTHRHHKNNETDATHARTEARMERAAQHKTREERREARRELQKQHPGGFDCGDSEKSAPAAVTAPALVPAPALLLQQWLGRLMFWSSHVNFIHIQPLRLLLPLPLPQPLLLLGFCGNFKYKLHCFYGYKCLFVIFLSLFRSCCCCCCCSCCVYKGLNDVGIGATYERIPF